jgi:hypothetical protein
MASETGRNTTDRYRRSSTFHQGSHASLYMQSGGERVHEFRKAPKIKSRTHLETELSGLNGSHESTRSCNKNALI